MGHRIAVKDNLLAAWAPSYNGCVLTPCVPRLASAVWCSCVLFSAACSGGAGVAPGGGGTSQGNGGSPGAGTGGQSQGSNNPFLMPQGSSGGTSRGGAQSSGGGAANAGASNAGASNGGAANASAGAGPDALCACYEQQAATRPAFRNCSVGVAPLPCTTTADCCASIPEGYVCGQDYPYLYECVAGACVSQPCTADAQCAASFTQTYQAIGYVGYECTTVDIQCSDQQYTYCSYLTATAQPTACQTAQDCCAQVPAGYTCNQDWPYLYECNNGACATASCTNNTQCNAYHAALNTGGTYENLGCVAWEDTCSGITSSSCQIQPAATAQTACTTAADCCTNVAAGYTCGQDYPYLYDCVNGHCRSQLCTTDSQCDVYFQETYAEYGTYENLGCAEY